MAEQIKKQEHEGQESADPLAQAEAALTQARDARDAHLGTAQPSEFEGERHTEWVQTRDQLNAAVDEREAEFGDQIEQAPAQQLNSFASLLASRRGHEGNEQAAAQLDQQIDDNWASQEQERESQANNRGPAGRGYANYAATAQEENASQQQWAQREHDVRQANLGQGSLTVEQIEQQEAQNAQQPQQRSAEEIAQAARDEQDWNARFLRGR